MIGTADERHYRTCHEAAAELDRLRAAQREHAAAWFALVTCAAAALEDAANCLRDPDAKRAAEGAAKHARDAAKAKWIECVGPNAELSGAAERCD